MLRHFYSLRIRPPVKTAFCLSLEPTRNAHTIQNTDGIQSNTASKISETRVGGKSEATTPGGETQAVEVSQTKRRRRRAAEIVGEDNDNPGPKERQRGVEIPLSDTNEQNQNLDLPPWKRRFWGSRGRNTKNPNPELSIVERKPGKRKDSAEKIVAFAEGGKKPRRAAALPKPERSDIGADKDSIENVGVKVIWSQKDLRKIVTSPYLSKGTKLQDLDPLARSLFEEYKEGGKRADYKRVNVVSSQLCDDVVERLRPTLVKHIGCDIIDISPGPGIWSAAIHNAVKPRTHVLLEPDYNIYRPHLQPLLDSDPTYKLLPKLGLSWNHFQRALSSEFLPHQVELSQDDPRIHEPNDTLLLIANVAYSPNKAYKQFPSVTPLFVHQLLSASRSNTLCHKYGRVRMLIWVSDEERHILSPRVLGNRKRSTMENELTCEYIEEVACSSFVHEKGYRDNYLKLQSSIDTMERMKRAGISTPHDRQSVLEIQAASGAKVPLDRNSISVTRGPDVALAEMEKRFADGEFAARLENPQRLTPGFNRTPEYYRLNILERRELKQVKYFVESEEQIAELKDLRTKLRNGEIQKYSIPEEQIATRSHQSTRAIYTPEYIRLRVLRGRAKSDANRNIRHYTYMQEYDAILKLQELAQQPSATEAIKEEARRHTALWKEKISQIPHEQRFSYMIHHDNKVGFHNKPPLLFWDRRRAEPLMVKANEFFPHHELALMDYQPKKLWPSLQENFQDSWHVMQYLIDSMTTRTTQSLKDALLNLGSGCLEWMIAECPSLTDPKKGGNMDLELVRVRTITTEMLQEIYEAYQRWPYKPSKNELIRLMGFKEHVNDPDVGYEMKNET